MEIRPPIDFYVKAIGDSDKFMKILKTLGKLGFRTVVIAYNTLDRECIFPKDSINILKLGESIGLTTFIRININSNSKGDLKKCLRKIRAKVDVVSVEPKTLDVARFSGRDKRIDTVFFNYNDLVNFYDESQAKLMSQNGIALEIPFKHLWHVGKFNYKMFFFLKRVIYYTLKFKVPLIVSSASSEIVDIKSPGQLTSLLEVLGLPEDYAKMAITSYPLAILKRNLHKKSRKHVQRGIDVVS